MSVRGDMKIKTLHDNHDDFVTVLKNMEVSLGDKIPDAKDNDNEYKQVRDNVRTALSLLNHRKTEVENAG